MINLSIDVASLGPFVLVLALSLVAGTALGFLCMVLGVFGDLALGLAQAIAGGRSSRSTAAPSVAPVLVRALLYVAILVGSFVLYASGFTVLAYLACVFGGVALPIAVIKVFARS